MRSLRVQSSYHKALDQYQTRPVLQRISWGTWIIAAVTTVVWCITAYHAAVAAGAHDLRGILANILANAINIRPQDNDALSNVLIAYGAKDNALILQGQYWRFITPIFLHANLLHLSMNILNLLVLGVFLERLLGHTRFLLVYFVSGVVSIIASFHFAPQELSVGASGAIFGLVGAYSLFILSHRRALRRGGLVAIPWLILVIGVNLSIGLFVQNVDNFAHIGGLLAGCLLGWWFAPSYRMSSVGVLTDVHSLSQRWPLALLTLIGTLLVAWMALHFTGG